MRIEIDRAICDGYGNCVFVAPEVFDLDDENLVTLLVDTITDETRPAVELAIDECPMRAISLVSS
jgi:ferredoxin